MRVEDAILVILGSLGGASATRIHKVLFLALVEGGVSINASFKAHYFGPWSPDVHSTLVSMINEGLVEELRGSTTESGYVTKTYRLTLKGREKLSSVLSHADQRDLYRLKQVIRTYGHTPITYLIAYIYSKYPEYTELSSIRDRVEAWKKFYRLGLRQ